VVGPQSLTVKVNQINKKAAFSQRLNRSQWSEAYSIPVKFRIDFAGLLQKIKKDCEIKEHLPKLF
jgi:long-subunit fatty acid transport protein